jgi:hypothetical protein
MQGALWITLYDKNLVCQLPRISCRVDRITSLGTDAALDAQERVFMSCRPGMQKAPPQALPWVAVLWEALAGEGRQLATIPYLNSTYILHVSLHERLFHDSSSANLSVTIPTSAQCALSLTQTLSPTVQLRMPSTFNDKSKNALSIPSFLLSPASAMQIWPSFS